MFDSVYITGTCSVCATNLSSMMSDSPLYLVVKLKVLISSCNLQNMVTILQIQQKVFEIKYKICVLKFISNTIFV